ncbi:MAG: hypothetical protein CMI63_05360 [Parvularcula sp.]|nr:hypothetical protein [Parvularcula sp.]
MKRPGLLKTISVLAFVWTAACGENVVQETGGPSELREALASPPAAIPVETPDVNARRGRLQFITRGCVICHQVNGVGGTAAPDLSAASAPDLINPLDFSARMWRGAPAMTALQAVELGYVIELDAQDIADLAAFAASPEEQKLLTLDSVPADMRDWFIDAPHWRSDDWTEYLQRGERIPGLEEEEL